MWYILASTNQATFAANWNSMLISNPTSGLTSTASYNALYNTAHSLGAPNYLGGVANPAIALPLASLFLFGGNYISGFGGEIKNVKKSIPIALFLSLIFGIIFWSVTSTLTLNTVGSNWMTAVGWNWLNNAATPAKYALAPIGPPTQPLMLAVAAYPNTFLIYLMFVMYLVGSIAPLFAYFWIPTKYFFSWSFDRAVPSKFAAMSQRFNTPYLSVAGIVILAVVLSYVYDYAGWSASFTVGSVVWGAAYVIPGLALMVFPFVKKNLFEQAPGFIKARVGGFPIISLVGLATAVGFAYIAYIGVGSPGAVGTISATFDFELIISVIIIGFIVYYASKFYYQSKGIDISLAYKDIPPE
jgi:basic amino acid/polyamine antiporter, APA family